MTPQGPMPRDKDSLLREINARIRIKDIKSLYRLREQISVKWYESLLILLLFVSALGFLAFVVLLLFYDGESARVLLERAVLIWTIPLVLTFVLTLEVILNKITSLRQLNELAASLLEAIQKQLERYDAGSGETRRQEHDETAES